MLHHKTTSLSCELTLLLAIVHAILSSQGLDHVLERKVSANIVAGANGALDLEDMHVQQESVQKGN